MPAISLSNTYTQAFDSLSNSGASNVWIDDSTLEGWYANRTIYQPSTGSSNTGSLYSFGNTGSSERALGSVASGGTGTIFYGVRFVNDTQDTIDTLDIGYVGEQWRNGGSTTTPSLAQTLDFQYQVDATSLTNGTWTDDDDLDFTTPVFGTTTASALDGNIAGNHVALSSSLTGLNLAPGQEIWFRWQDINDTNNDHGVAIDTLLVSTGTPIAGIALTESGGSTQVNEAGETTDTYTLALNTNPTAPVTITITADEQTLISTDGINFAATQTLSLDDTAPAIITVKAIDDELSETSPHAGVITHSVSSSDPDYASLSVPPLIFNVQDNDILPSLTKINQIQGSGLTFDPLFGGMQTIEAIVVGDFQQVGTVQNLRGFYVQEEDTDADSNLLTSEGLFIFEQNLGLDVQIGDKVRITGTVAEFASSGSSLTQLTTLSNVTVVSTGNMLPTAATLTFPVMSISDLEAVEGMRVTIPETLTVTEHFQLGRFGQVILSADGDSNQAGTDGRLDQYTQFNAPSVGGYAAYLDEIAKRRIVLDDALTIQNPDPIIHGRGGNPLSASNTLRGGDTVAGLSGIADHRFGDYRIQPVAPIDFEPTNPRTTVPDVGGTLKVASFNVLNYFNGDGLGGGFPTSRGADNLSEFNRQRDKTIAAILGLDADVVGLIEIENDGYGTTSAIQDLVNGLNAIAGAGTYALIDPGLPNLGTDEIAVGFIYKPGSITPVGSAVTVADGFGMGAFDDNNRKPLAQTFQQNSNGAQFTAVINHFKSKGSSSGGLGDEDINDGQGLSNGTRLRAAQDLAAWLTTNPTGTTDADYLLLGDFNAYSQEDPITALEAAGYRNLVSDTSYSFVFNGQWGSLDHALSSSSLSSQVTGALKWHINADEPTVLDYNTNFKSPAQISSLYEADPYRSSDHDPVLVGLNLQTPVSLSISASGNPAEAGIVPGTFTLSRDGSTSGDLTVNFTLGGNATLGADYTLSGADLIDGTVTIPDGQSAVEITITPVDDSLFETAETVELILSSGSASLAIADNDFNVFNGSPGPNLLIGTIFNDRINGGAGDDTINGNEGNDLIEGNLGSDILSGNDGNDTLNGGNGNDLLDGGSGIDTADYSGLKFKGLLSTDLGLDANLATGIAQHSSQNNPLGSTDTLVNLENLTGTSRRDRLVGDSGDNLLVGGKGKDTLTGGGGSDRFGYRTCSERGDTLVDFVVGEDLIEVSQLLDSVGYIGSDPLTDGYLRTLLQNGNTLVQFDGNGGGDRFVTLATLQGITTSLTLSSFAI